MLFQGIFYEEGTGHIPYCLLFPFLCQSHERIFHWCTLKRTWKCSLKKRMWHPGASCSFMTAHPASNSSQKWSFQCSYYLWFQWLLFQVNRSQLYISECMGLSSFSQWLFCVVLTILDEFKKTYQFSDCTFFLIYVTVIASKILTCHKWNYSCVFFTYPHECFFTFWHF
jgi:hypothetical protein